MRFLNFIACNLLQISVVSMLLQYIACKCKFPDKNFPGGIIKNWYPRGAVETFAEEFYILQYECLPGYELVGMSHIKCEDGKWVPEIPLCAMIFCGPPPALVNGTILELQSTNSTSFPYDFGLTYVCDKDHRLIGDTWRACTERGWSGKSPTCELIQCPEPGVPENGIRVGESCTVGSSVHFDCHNGYDLQGSPERFCLPNGQWTGELARCHSPSYYCPDPGTPIKGFKNSTDYSMGSKITFRCLDGYSQLGSKVRECLVDHKWSGTEAKCLRPYDFHDDSSLVEKLSEEIFRREEKQRREFEKCKDIRSGLVTNLHYKGRIVLYFAFHVSKGIGRDNLYRSIEFAKAIVKKVGISEFGTRAGVLTFDFNVQELILPLNYQTTEEVLNALDRVEYIEVGETGSGSAFNLLRRDILPLMNEVLGTLNTKSIIFLFTDGRIRMTGSLLKEVEDLKKTGIEIFCIGITEYIKHETLYRLASKSRNEYGEAVFNVYIFKNDTAPSTNVQEINGKVDYSQCGLQLENTRNGSSLKGKPWPWLATVFVQETTTKYKVVCRGSVIHQNFILTAAHCFFEVLKTVPLKTDRKSVFIKLGLTDTENEAYVHETAVLDIFIHPKYRAGISFDYDIAVVQIERPAEFNYFIRPICLPPRELQYNSVLYQPHASAWTTSWGHDANASVCNIRMRTTQNYEEIYIPIQSKDTCIESLVKSGMNISYFTDRMFCAGHGTGRTDLCSVDGGEPLLKAQINSEGSVYWTQIGILSWSIKCGFPDTYVYYTYLQRLVPWVYETTENALKAIKI